MRVASYTATVRNGINNMEARDIILGAWLKFRGASVKITGIKEKELCTKYTDWQNIGLFRPITLTVQMLLDNGFEYAGDKGHKMQMRKVTGKNTNITLLLHVGGTWSFRDGPKRKFRYLHEFQQGLAFCGRKDYIRLLEDFKYNG